MMLFIFLLFVFYCANGRPVSYCDQAYLQRHGEDGAPAYCPMPPKPICKCPKILKPVKCGWRGKKFNNICLAKCAGYDKWDCEPVKPCACPRIYKPVKCGWHGKKFSNLCLAQCEGFEKWECEPVHPVKPPVCACPDVWDPVVCSDGKTYGNECEARCKRQFHCKKKPPKPKPCICPMIYKPVFCDGGKKYSNMCVARCNNAKHCNEHPILCRCANINKPVFCPKTGKVYPNQCSAGCEGLSKCIPLKRPHDPIPLDEVAYPQKASVQ